MTSTDADRTIAALQSGHDTLVAHVQGLSQDAVEGRSGASEWSIAQVLSHLGSGAEINSTTLDVSLGGAPAPGDDFNQGVWARWDAMQPREQVEAFVTADSQLVERYAAIDAQTREQGTIDLGFLPAPVDVATAAGFRLNEYTLHAWDVAVGTDPGATLAPEAVEPLLSIAPVMLGWIGKPDVLDGRHVTVAVRLSDLDRELGLRIDDSVSLVDVPTEPEATLTLPAESWIRLLYGRLGPDHTPDSVETTGAITLDELRQVFPGL